MAVEIVGVVVVVAVVDVVVMDLAIVVVARGDSGCGCVVNPLYSFIRAANWC